jgi:hypothetical protein
MEDTADLLRSIAAEMSRSSKEAENQNKIQREQLDFIKEKEAKKKNKAEKWNARSRRLVLNAVLTDSNSPAEDIPASYLTVINSDTAGMADKELQSQMAGLGRSDAGFAHGLAASLYAGDIKWNSRTTPSNLSPFTVFELDPLSATQSERCMHLHILSKNTEGKLLKDIKASQIQEVKVCVCSCPPVMGGVTVKHALTSTSSPPNDIPSIPWSPVVLPLRTPPWELARGVSNGPVYLGCRTPWLLLGNSTT